MEGQIPRPVHDTHAAASQLALQFVAAEMSRLGGPQPGWRRAGVVGRVRWEQEFELGLEQAHVKQASLNLGEQLRGPLAHLLRALTRVEDHLNQVSRVAFTGHRRDPHRFSPTPGRRESPAELDRSGLNLPPRPSGRPEILEPLRQQHHCAIPAVVAPSW